MRSWRLLLACMISLLFVLQAWALQVMDVYDVALTRSSEQIVDKDFEQGLETVLQRVATDVDVPSLLQEARPKIRSYVTHYASESVDGAAKQWRWSIRYDATMVHHLILEHKGKIFSHNRPVVLVWVAIGNDKERHLVSHDNAGAVLEVLEAQAQHLKVPMVFPILDVEDRQNVALADVWGQFQSPLSYSAQRYDADAIMAIRLYQSPDGAWLTQWQLRVGEQSWVWKVDAADLPGILKAGSLHAIQTLAQHYAHEGRVDQDEAFLLEVQGVATFEDYARLTHYLERVATVDHFLPTHLEAQRVTFKVFPLGSAKGVMQSLALEYVLIPEKTFEVEVPRGHMRTLQYRLTALEP